jgi:hypothetical protein
MTTLTYKKFGNCSVDEWIDAAKKLGYELEIGLQDANEPMMEAYEPTERMHVGSWYMPSNVFESYLLVPV